MFAIGGAIGDCVTDSFVLTAPGNKGSPTICGINTGQHSMYIETIDWFLKVSFEFTFQFLRKYI